MPVPVEGEGEDEGLRDTESNYIDEDREIDWDIRAFVPMPQLLCK